MDWESELNFTSEIEQQRMEICGDFLIDVLKCRSVAELAALWERDGDAICSLLDEPRRESCIASLRGRKTVLARAANTAALNGGRVRAAVVAA